MEPHLKNAAAPAPSSLANDVNGPPDRGRLQAIIEDAMNSAVSEPWEAAGHAADRILAALSPEAPAREGVEALRTALIKARSELAIQYCYSAGRMGITGCYPELAEKYGGSAIVQEIDAVLALTPRHEAPAREGVALDKRIADAAERDRRERDKAFRGESYEPLTPRHEAPAEGAGEFARQMEILRKAASVPVPDDDNDFTVEKARRGSESWRVIAANVLREYDRARSSAPEAREEALGNLLAVIHGDGGHRALEVGTKQAALEAEKIVARLLSSAPEAREGEAVGWKYRASRDGAAGRAHDLYMALAEVKEQVVTYPLSDNSTCMCGAPLGGHNVGSGHAPVSLADHAISLIVEAIDKALRFGAPTDGRPDDYEGPDVGMHDTEISERDDD